MEVFKEDTALIKSDLFIKYIKQSNMKELMIDIYTEVLDYLIN